MNEILIQYREVQESIEDLIEQSCIIAGNVIKIGMKAIFERYPEVESIGWRQYTPYWNDGAPCVFRAEVDDILINGEYCWDLEENESFDKASQAATALLSTVSYRDLLGLYDDHADISFNRNGTVCVSEFDHD